VPRTSKIGAELNARDHYRDVARARLVENWIDGIGREVVSGTARHVFTDDFVPSTSEVISGAASTDSTCKCPTDIGGP
jgi:hypothetical protein